MVVWGTIRSALDQSLSWCSDGIMGDHRVYFGSVAPGQQLRRCRGMFNSSILLDLNHGILTHST